MGWVTVIVAMRNKSNCVIHKNTLSICDMTEPQLSVIGSRFICQCLTAVQGYTTKYLCRNDRHSGNLCNSRNTALMYCVGCYVNDDGILTWNIKLPNLNISWPRTYASVWEWNQQVHTKMCEFIIHVGNLLHVSGIFCCHFQGGVLRRIWYKELTTRG